MGAPPIAEKNNCYTSPTRLVAYLEPFVRLQKQSIEELELMNECSGKWSMNYMPERHCSFNNHAISPSCLMKSFYAVSIGTTVHYVWFSQFWSHFRREMHCLPHWLKSTLFEIFSNGAVAVRRGQWSEKKFQTKLILVFEVILQPPKTHFLTF